MSKVDYDTMTDAELRHYFLRQREDREEFEAAFEAYMDRVRKRPKKVIARPDDPDFEIKIEAAIREKLQKSS